ncbi:glycosyltransferase family 39 protein [Gordonia sp. ABSL1-1]|uniref:glycosyltransferase family 39 protein n=1 Tax=Gordonia sp. ABSL1-1 TaxID=3053923 RepID=UPI002573E757|nr:glycosyltransferase family 39 protein [Gordonia sp. ABSL1-1]MDL9935384.1 glycosyltransferase family 39 protein [Gordonia sp. ABSL1-1]
MTAALDHPEVSVPDMSAGAAEPPGTAARVRRWFAARPVSWSPFALAGLLVSTALLYLVNLSANGYANSFYAAAAWAGSESWKAWFFGALDPSNFITVDKPPASLWVTGLSVRIFGMNSWAVLVPQALMGVAAVALVYATMRRVFDDPKQGTVAGLIAGGVLAFTPAAALMFRFNNPDALLVLLMVAAGYALARAIAADSGRWLALVGVALGFAFLTKMLQGLLVLPAFGLAYLLCANNGWGRRIVALLGAAAALVVSAGWFVVVTMLVPGSSRPYIGGSADNSFMDLVWGYNGVGRISGGEGGPGGGRGGPGGGGAAGGSFGGETGLHRLFSSEMGNEISWLLPVALIALIFAAYLLVRGLRDREFQVRLTRKEVGAVIAWGGWLLVTGLIFSFMSGTIHPYYTVALAPAIGVLIGFGAVQAWRRREHWDGRITMAAMIVGGSAWSVVLLQRNDFGPAWCRWVIGVVAVIAAIGVVAGGRLGMRRVLAAALIAGSIATAGGTVAFTIATAATEHTGSIPTAVNTSMPGGGMGGPGGGPGGPGARDGGSAPGGPGMGGPGMGVPLSGAPGGARSDGPGDGGQDGRQPRGMGGMSLNSELTELLKNTDTTWAAAVGGSQMASQIEVATLRPVMAMGGWSGDPTPTLDQFIGYVKQGKIAYYIGGSGAGGPGGGRGSSSEISAWVAENFTATQVGGMTVYKLN